VSGHVVLGRNAQREITEMLFRLLDRLPGLRLVAGDEPASFAFRRPPTLEFVRGAAPRGGGRLSVRAPILPP